MMDFFTPLYFEPHLRLFSFPKKCPKTVCDALNESFRLFFSNPSAAVNNVRIAIEALLTELGIKRFSTSNGKRRPIALHHRINLLPVKLAQQKTLLIAAKWLGNNGSHRIDAINKDDALDACELIDHVLQEIYDSKSKKIQALAKKVNKKKGPVASI